MGWCRRGRSGWEGPCSSSGKSLYNGNKERTIKEHPAQTGEENVTLRQSSPSPLPRGTPSHWWFAVCPLRFRCSGGSVVKGVQEVREP